MRAGEASGLANGSSCLSKGDGVKDTEEKYGGGREM